MNNFFSGGDKESNFFNKSENTDYLSEIKLDEEKPLKEQYNDIKNNYEEIFIQAAESIRRELNQFKPENPCANCSIKDCSIEKKDIFSHYPAGCKYRDWQLQALTYLAGDYRQKLKAEYNSIMDRKNNYKCNRCGECCKLAVSEFSYDQLKQRAMRGDKYSEEFISIFVPFENEEEAKKINPEYFEMLNILVSDEKIYYYHCPKIDENNLCTIYEQRPNICRDFPYNPLKLLPSQCSFNEWKNAVSHDAMLLKAKTDIINFYKEKLQ